MPSADNTTHPMPTRRERLRAQTIAEIKAAARSHLVAHGVGGVQLRAVARDLGMTAPGLYRYFDSHEALVVALVGDLYGELAERIEVAADPRRGNLWDRLSGSARAFRDWSVEHPQEFTLLFGSPIPGVEVEDGPEHEQARRFGQAFGRLFAELWATQPFPVSDIDPTWETELAAYADNLDVPTPLPPAAVAVFLSCWVRLYGVVTMEVFGHIAFALSDAEPLFESELAALGERLNVAPGA